MKRIHGREPQNRRRSSFQDMLFQILNAISEFFSLGNPLMWAFLVFLILYFIFPNRTVAVVDGVGSIANGILNYIITIFSVSVDGILWIFKNLGGMIGAIIIDYTSKVLLLVSVGIALTFVLRMMVRMDKKALEGTVTVMILLLLLLIWGWVVLRYNHEDFLLSAILIGAGVILLLFAGFALRSLLAAERKPFQELLNPIPDSQGEEDSHPKQLKEIVSVSLLSLLLVLLFCGAVYLLSQQHLMNTYLGEKATPLQELALMVSFCIAFAALVLLIYNIIRYKKEKNNPVPRIGFSALISILIYLFPVIQGKAAGFSFHQNLTLNTGLNILVIIFCTTLVSTVLGVTMELMYTPGEELKQKNWLFFQLLSALIDTAFRILLMVLGGFTRFIYILFDVLLANSSEVPIEYPNPIEIVLNKLHIKDVEENQNLVGQLLRFSNSRMKPNSRKSEKTIDEPVPDQDPVKKDVIPPAEYPDDIFDEIEDEVLNNYLNEKKNG